MIDLRGHQKRKWPDELRPRGEGTWEKEAFGPWWERNKDRLPGIHPLVAEQWIHRHWENSPYCHLDQDRITCRLETWPTERLLAEVVRPDPADDINLNHDWMLYRDRDLEPAATVRTTGTWNIPIVIIEALHGALRFDGVDSRRFYLIEGHQRMRCLAAFQHYATCATEHEVFVLDYFEIIKDVDRGTAKSS
jgi:hypothetical protein